MQGTRTLTGSWSREDGLVPDQKTVPCRVQVGESVQEFWIAADLLSSPPSRNNDARQNAVMRQFATKFADAYAAEAVRLGGQV